MSNALPQTPPNDPVTLYTLFRAKVAEGQLRSDPAQLGVLSALDDLRERYDHYAPPRLGFFQRLMGVNKSNTDPKGLYLYGKVGRGKSMLMDLFFAHINIKKKRRVHFHQFMLELHDRLHKMQSERVDDILPEVAKDIAADAWLLCFDEFHVNNIADAMILGRLFEALFAAGVIVVATSNSAPDELYKNGLQRDRFLPFLEILKQHMIVYNLDGAIDHRFEQTRDLQCYFTPLGEETTRALQGLFIQMTGDVVSEILELPVKGRNLKIIHAAKGIGFFNFEELCRVALAAADYLAIASCLHTVIIDNVPKFQGDARDETLRFMTLIDTLYEAKVKLYIGAAVPPEKLCMNGEYQEAFQRTVSRLVEMQGVEYRKKPHLFDE